MSSSTNDAPQPDRARIAALRDQYLQHPTATSADRRRRDELLDELQDAVGLAGRMVTERDILRQTEKLLATP